MEAGLELSHDFIDTDRSNAEALEGTPSTALEISPDGGTTLTLNGGSTPPEPPSTKSVAQDGGAVVESLHLSGKIRIRKSVF